MVLIVFGLMEFMVDGMEMMLFGFEIFDLVFEFFQLQWIGVLIQVKLLDILGCFVIELGFKDVVIMWMGFVMEGWMFWFKLVLFDFFICFEYLSLMFFCVGVVELYLLQFLK